MSFNSPMNIEKICQLFEIGEEGIYPNPGASLFKDNSLSLYAFDITAKQIIDMALSFCRNPQIIEAFVSLDAFTQPGQGTELDSVLCIFHMKRGCRARVGVMEYSWNEGDPITKPICWDNKFWQEAYADLLADMSAGSDVKNQYL